jgi:hypothetical protein
MTKKTTMRTNNGNKKINFFFSFARHVLNTAELNVLFSQRDRKLKVNYEINSKRSARIHTCAQHINAQFRAHQACNRKIIIKREKKGDWRVRTILQHGIIAKCGK